MTNNNLNHGMKKLTGTYYHWGPFLFHSKITPDECQMLLDEGKKCRKKSNDHRHHLAGHLSEEYRLTNTKGISAWLKKYLAVYTESYKTWRGGNHKLPDLHINIFWINYMKSNDFNPPHDHSGALSFVIYPEVPEEIIKENKNYKGSATGPGAISWLYGEGHIQYISQVSEMPQTGDLFIFPARLHHWVFPFRSNVERVSVSGNISFVEEKSHV